MSGLGNVSRPPLGVCYLKAYLAKKGYEARIFHQVDETDEQIVASILKYGANIIGFSVMSCVFNSGIRLARVLKEENNNLITIFGGEHITAIFADEMQYGSDLMTNTLKKNPAIDFLVPFEGEKALVGLIKGLEEGKLLDEIDGIVFYKNSATHVTKRVPRIIDLDELPMPDRSDLPYHKYHSPDDDNLEYMHTARGCKFRCSYCCTPVSNPGAVAYNSAKRMADEVEFVYKNYKRESFFFCDELFTADPKRVEKFCNKLIGRRISEKINWRVFARVDDVSEGKINLSLMKKAGLKGLFFGVESMNLSTLRKLGKGTNPEQIFKAIKITSKAGIDVWSSLMIGYPWETEEELKKSLADYLKMKRYITHNYVSFITPFPGTRFYRQCVENNWLVKKDHYLMDCSEPVLSSPIPKARLLKIHDQFIKALN